MSTFVWPTKAGSRIPVTSNRRRFEWKLSDDYCTPRRGRNNQSTPETLETTEPMPHYPHNSPCLKFFNYIPAEDFDRSSFTLSQNSHVSIGVETDRYHGWIPLPRDPLSDCTFLPPIVVPESSAFGSHPTLFNSWAPKPWP
ncbi:hypothetical protein PSACC_02086 [Paramicrosporidium saccamoebae]|uniref:Uncharacterized protein n=1 Tax=Paramicrosporidium saccamoebae TaxID=1246581 RepID=A0A2H9TKC7_9FUNG|nr:hypothetical protein PSACC_02086 [Paramicrosporidium saccamoebae]